MSMIGLFGLLISFMGVVVSIVCLLAGQLLARKSSRKGSRKTPPKAFRKSSPKTSASKGEIKQTASEGSASKDGPAGTFSWAGHVAVLLSAAALTVCCGLLVYCFFAGDLSIVYVVENQSNAVGASAWLYKLSGLWAGREGSLLFWAWLISIFTAVCALRNLKKIDPLDNMALLVAQVVLAAFVGVLLFSESNMPFMAMDPAHITPEGRLTGEAAMWGMNNLLEHWAMAIHPPTLFIGYAGLTMPFAYAIAALIVNDPSKRWVERATRYTLFSWFFLGIGIGLGAVWAYVVLGWGGYWGWDPVENASLLSWLTGLALIHCFTVYRTRKAFKRWSVMCACLTFAFVVVGTFITRSGIVQSVHAFEGDNISLVLFLFLIIASVLAGALGLALRWKSFGSTGSGGENVDSLTSRDAAYYLNNVILIVFSVLLCYLTVSSALPTFLPFGGQSVSTGTYNAIAWPLGILYCLLMAVCPLLSWGRTQGRVFWKRARTPGICALVVFALLMVYFFTALLPAYEATIAAGGAGAEKVSVYGPAFYYNGLAILGLLTASLLFFNALFILGRTVTSYAKKYEVGLVAAFFASLRYRASAFGGYLSHVAMGIILVGLIGSSMYVTEQISYLSYDEASDSFSEDFVIREYTLKYVGSSVEEQSRTDILYQVDFDVYRNGAYLGQAHPSVLLDAMTQQQRLNAWVIGSPLEDLFIVYRGVDSEGAFSMDVRVNPLVSFAWIGFGLLMLGCLVSTSGGRSERREPVLVSGSADALVSELAERSGSAEAPELAEATADAESPGSVASEAPGSAASESSDPASEPVSKTVPEEPT